jgi:hypothetical protein
MPDGTRVWVTHAESHVLVYADESLATESGELTPEGRREVNAGLAEVPGAPSLESAKPCGEHLL